MLSLFSGAGGLDFGFEAAGFRTAGALELDADCCRTLRQNRAWPVLEGDIGRTSAEYLLGYARLAPGEVDVLVGGPPCQPFSKSGYWASGDAKRLEDPRAKTLQGYLRMLEHLLPGVFLLENVRGISYSGKNEGLTYLQEQIEGINRRTGARYAPSWRVLKATDFGVPQSRERFFMVAQRDGAEFAWPEPTHRDPELEGTLSPYRTAWDALGDLEPPSADLSVAGKWGPLLPSIPEGHCYDWHTERRGGLPLFGWRRHYFNFLRKLAKDRPSWTLQAQPGPAIGPFHWHSRRLSPRELARIQTFPDDVEISGTLREVQRQLGNAVPSLLAEVLARHIRTQLLGLPALEGPPSLLPPDRGPPPPPEPVAEVPERFLDRLGSHAAHPGTGKGYGALRRASTG